VTSTSGAPGLEAQVAARRAELDAHVREMVAWHFDPATGCPFWLEYAARLPFERYFRDARAGLIMALANDGTYLNIATALVPPTN